MSEIALKLFSWVNARLPIVNTFERHLSKHPVPSKVIADEFITKYDPDYINKILVDTDAVVILSHEEDNILKKNGLNKVMPKNWKFGDSIFARYDLCEIKVLEKKIKMKGAIRR